MTTTGITYTPGPGDLTSSEQDAILAAARITEFDARWPRLMDMAREQKAQHAAAVEQRDGLAHALDEAGLELDSVRNVLRQERTAHARFREQVRDVAIRVAGEQGWCTSGLNDVLDELGLPRKATEWEVEVTVTAAQTVTVTVEADDEDEAKQKIVDGDVDLSDELDRNGWEWQTADDLNFEDVREA